MSTDKLTILFAPLDYRGHVNACHGIAETLLDHGHRVVFANEQPYASDLESYGFEVEVTTSLWEKEEAEADLDLTSQVVLDNMDLFEQGSLVMTDKFCLPAFNNMYKNLRNKSQQYKDIIERVRPDLIIIDSYVGCPQLTDSGIPWVWLFSAAPLHAFNHPELPPAWSGYPTNGDNKEEWPQFRQKMNEMFETLFIATNEWYEEEGAPPLPSNTPTQLHPISPYMNLYMYPKELDYEQSESLGENWRRVDGFVRTTDDTFEMPEHLRDRSGKLVFLSMGSIGCSHINLMKRLVEILAKSEHKFIISKGPIGDMYELADNMWGEKFVPQTALLPLVDLVITHGGNNTVTESLFFGKPMIAMPLFADQYDNAQRIHETGLGLRLHPFHCTEDELLEAVDRLVTDEELKQKLSDIGNRIRGSNDKQVIADLLEKIASNSKSD